MESITGEESNTSKELIVMRHWDGVVGADLEMRRGNSSQKWSRSLRKLNVQLSFYTALTDYWQIFDYSQVMDYL